MIAWSVNCLTHRREDLSVNPRSHIKAARNGVIAVQGSRNRRVSGTHWPASLAVCPRPVRDNGPPNKMGMGCLDLLVQPKVTWEEGTSTE